MAAWFHNTKNVFHLDFCQVISNTKYTNMLSFTRECYAILQRIFIWPMNDTEKKTTILEYLWLQEYQM